MMLAREHLCSAMSERHRRPLSVSASRAAATEEGRCSTSIGLCGTNGDRDSTSRSGPAALSATSGACWVSDIALPARRVRAPGQSALRCCRRWKGVDSRCAARPRCRSILIGRGDDATRCPFCFPAPVARVPTASWATSSSAPRRTRGGVRGDQKARRSPCGSRWQAALSLCKGRSRGRLRPSGGLI